MGCETHSWQRIGSSNVELSNCCHKMEVNVKRSKRISSANSCVVWPFMFILGGVLLAPTGEKSGHLVGSFRRKIREFYSYCWPRFRTAVRNAEIGEEGKGSSLSPLSFSPSLAFAVGEAVRALTRHGCRTTSRGFFNASDVIQAGNCVFLASTQAILIQTA